MGYQDTNKVGYDTVLVSSIGTTIDTPTLSADYVPASPVFAVYVNTAGNLVVDMGGKTGVSMAVPTGYTAFAPGNLITKISSTSTAVLAFVQR